MRCERVGRASVSEARKRVGCMSASEAWKRVGCTSMSEAEETSLWTQRLFALVYILRCVSLSCCLVSLPALTACATPRAVELLCMTQRTQVYVPGNAALVMYSPAPRSELLSLCLFPVYTSPIPDATSFRRRRRTSLSLTKPLQRS